MENQIRTVLLLGMLSGLLLAVGYLLGGMSGLTFAIAFAIIMNWGSYFWSDRIALFMYKAKELKAEEQPKLFSMVKDVASRAGLPMPRVFLIPSEQSNAFATGRNPTHASIAVTRGILSLLDEQELKGVIAHELSHVKNRDILVATIAATIASVISYVGFVARWGAIFGGFGGRDNDRGGILELLLLAIVTPLIALLLQLAISRSREYLADETGARILRDSSGLASALEKLEQDTKRHPLRLGSPASAHLFITNPFTKKGLLGMLSTHPPMEKRIARLRQLRF
ncbi:MAG: zinc metalloprotease HtpX [DPANN group archaeon]|nr:zinc metalloprotease HtpX [DPANN group archaeon]